MRYIGSKSSTLEALTELVRTHVSEGSFCDPFGGIGVVGSHFKRNGYRVTVGDHLLFPHYFQVARIERNRGVALRRVREALGVQSTAEILKYLNSARTSSKWLVQEYSQKRLFFTPENATRISACWSIIKAWDAKGLLTSNEKAVLLASLIESADKVANTAGTYYAYLKQFHRKARKPFEFRLIKAVPGSSKCKSYMIEAIELVKRAHYDIVYLDPPYNGRNYGSYYHFPETIAKCAIPRVAGVSGMPARPKTLSDFNSPARAANALEELLSHVRCGLLLFHYTDTGLVPQDRVREILTTVGNCDEFVLEASGYTTRRGARGTQHRLYLVTHG